MIERAKFDEILSSLIEELASIEHERWSHWQRHVHSKCIKQSDGSLVIPPDLVGRWEQQAMTVYSELSAEEKESDRKQVRRYLPIILSALSKQKIPAT